MDLLEQIKQYLKVSWDDEDTLIENYINRGKAKLNELVGAELDFETEGHARSLLFDFVRYAYNNATEYFEENFRSEILRLQLMTGVSLMTKDDENAEV